MRWVDIGIGCAVSMAVSKDLHHDADRPTPENRYERPRTGLPASRRQNCIRVSNDLPLEECARPTKARGSR